MPQRCARSSKVTQRRRTHPGGASSVPATGLRSASVNWIARLAQPSEAIRGVRREPGRLAGRVPCAVSLPLRHADWDYHTGPGASGPSSVHVASVAPQPPQAPRPMRPRGPRGPDTLIDARSSSRATRQCSVPCSAVARCRARPWLGVVLGRGSAAPPRGRRRTSAAPLTAPDSVAVTRDRARRASALLGSPSSTRAAASRSTSRVIRHCRGEHGGREQVGTCASESRRRGSRWRWSRWSAAGRTCFLLSRRRPATWTCSLPRSC